MTMRFLFIIDPLETLNLGTETSLLLIEEMHARGHAVFVATLPGLFGTEQGAGVRAAGITLDFSRERFYDLAPAEDRPFEDFDLVLMRKDPPVDVDYLAATFVLERAATVVPVVNDPVALRTINEKLWPLSLPEFTPPTLISGDIDRVTAFAAAHGRIVLKPLEDCSGRGIQFVDRHDAGEVIRRYMGARTSRSVVAQKFLDGVAAGDKRIMLLAGEPIGAVNRIPSSPHHLANIHQGARVEATTLTHREQAIITAVRPLLQRHRIVLAGLDVIDGYLTEINVTSPSAARQINQVSRSRVEVPIVDCLERIGRGARRGRATSLRPSPAAG